jgi:hypothetical protein
MDRQECFSPCSLAQVQSFQNEELEQGIVHSAEAAIRPHERAVWRLYGGGMEIVEKQQTFR